MADRSIFVPLLSVAAALSGCIGATGAMAQHAPVGQFSPRTTMVSRLDATMAIAGCVVRRDQKAASGLVVADPDSPQGRRFRNDITRALQACLKAGTGSLTLSALDLRGVMAEIMLKESDNAALLRARGMTAIMPRRMTSIDSAGAKDALFDCVVRAQPTDAASMIVAAPATVPEAAAFRTLLPSLQACVPTGAEVRLKPYQVRLLVAAALYRQANPALGA